MRINRALTCLILALIIIPLLSLARADQTISLDLKSDTSTLIAGYTTSKPESPLEPSLYSGQGAWSPTVVVYRTYWLGPSSDSRFADSHATWINSAYNWSEVGTGDAWRLFKAQFTLPYDITIQNASIIATADDTFEIWFNGAVIGTSGNVYGEAPANQFTDPMYDSVFGPYTFKPVSGLNTLYIVVRNYDTQGIVNYYSSGDSNPTGLLYRANVNYVSVSESAIPDFNILITVLGIVIIGSVLVSSFYFYRHKRTRTEYTRTQQALRMIVCASTCNLGR